MATAASGTERLLSRLAHFCGKLDLQGRVSTGEWKKQALAFREIRDALDVNRDWGERGCRERSTATPCRRNGQLSFGATPKVRQAAPAARLSR